jgi:AcrR family transcriptional regulator
LNGAQGPRPRGRRPGESRAREEILSAARQLFTARGYDQASLREIAAGAGADPALVRHYFGNKEGLFIAAMRMPDLQAALVTVLGPSEAPVAPSEIGERIVRMLGVIWSDPELPVTLTGLVRTAATNEQGAAMLREFIRHAVLGRIAQALPVPDADLRAALVGSQIFGLLMARLVLRLEPIASMPVEHLVRAVAPTLQRYLTGEIGQDPP